MFNTVLPAIPRFLTAISEWMACSFIILFFLQNRFTKKKTIFMVGIFLFVFCFIHYIIYFTIVTFFHWSIGMLFTIFVMMFYIWICAKISLSTVVACGSIAFIMAEFMASLEYQLQSYIPLKGVVGDFVSVIFMIIVLVIIQFGFYHMEKRIQKGYLFFEWKQTLQLLTIALLQLAVSNMAFAVWEWESESFIFQISLSYIRILVDACALCLLYSLQKSYQENNLKLEMSSINYMLNLQYKQYLDFKSNSEYISRQCHDLKHQIEALRSADSKDEREQYLKEMEQAIQEYNAQNVTGNPVLDTILTQKKIYCSQNNIQLSCIADARLLNHVAVRDISIIFGNILDNAIECVSQYEKEEDRVIYGEVYQKNNFLMIKFDNCFYGELAYNNELPKTTKADKERHGIGLKSVIYTVKKYKGIVRIESDKRWFSIKILIPINIS